MRTLDTEGLGGLPQLAALCVMVTPGGWEASTLPVPRGMTRSYKFRHPSPPMVCSFPWLISISPFPDVSRNHDYSLHRCVL